MIPPTKPQINQPQKTASTTTNRTPYVKETTNKPSEGIHFWLTENGLIICDAKGENRLMAASKLQQNGQAKICWTKDK